MEELCHNVEAYLKYCNIYLALKAVCYKFYIENQFLFIPMQQWKDFLIDFVTGLTISIN